jgi:uncharacterized protein (TIGR03435 family)
VAVVRLNKSGELRYILDPPRPGRFRAVNVPLRTLIGYAYEVPAYRLKGGPSWLSDQRFDVEGIAEGEANIENTRAMLRRLLSDRFDLRTRRETQQDAIFTLVIARRDGKLGSQLRRSQLNCDAATASPGCNYLGPSPDVAISTGRAYIALRGVTMERFSRFLSGMVGRDVIDRTKLGGHYDGEFEFTAEFGPPPPPPGITDPYDRAGFPSIFSVVADQLGLRLESSTGPVDVIRIDAVSRLRQE